MRTISTRGYGSHGMANRIKEIHGTNPITERTQSCNEHINHKQPAGRISNFGPEFIYIQSCNLGRKDLRILQLIHRNQSKRKNHDTQTSQPLYDASPKKNTMRLIIDIIQHRSSRSGKTGHRFKESIFYSCGRSIKQEGQHTQKRENHPYQSHDQETVLTRQFGFRTSPSDQKKSGSDHKSNQCGIQQCFQILIATTMLIK